MLIAVTVLALGPVGARASIGPPPIGPIANPGGGIQLYVPVDLHSLLEPIRSQHHLPALAGAIVTSQRLMALGVAGVRKYGDPTLAKVNDQFHLGSDTKSMTATLIAMLVEEGKLHWDETIAQAFPELIGLMKPAYAGITLTQLLAHRGGFAHGLQKSYGIDWFNLSGDIQSQRQLYVDLALAEPPLVPPGTQFSYSNTSYIIAGAMAERATGQSWETLITQRLFQPLGMATAGFGAMGAPGPIMEPWQHTLAGRLPNPITPGPTADNPPYLGPAGRVHCSLVDWSKYIAMHLQGAKGQGGLLTPRSFQRLHTDPFGDGYGYGWIFTDRDWGSGTVMTHAGSNTMNYAVVWVAPQKDFAVLVATNEAGAGIPEACDEAVGALIQYQLAHP